MQDGRTGLSHAARNGHEEAARILLNAGAHPSEPDLVRKRLRCDSPPSLRTVLSTEQLPAFIVVMLRLSCRLLQVQWNPLHYASAYGHANIVRVLLQSEKVEANAVTDVRMCWDLQLIYHESSIRLRGAIYGRRMARQLWSSQDTARAAQNLRKRPFKAYYECIPALSRGGRAGLLSLPRAGGVYLWQHSTASRMRRLK